MKSARIFGMLLLISLSWLATGCGSPDTPTPTPNLVATTSDPGVLLTAAVQTADTLIAQTALAAATPAPSSTDTPAATTQAQGQPTLEFPIGTPGSAAAFPDAMEFVTDLTVPDGTAFTPGQKFIKTWRLKNIGSSTWSTAYNLVFTGGEAMEGPASVLLPASVPPGGTLDISVDLVAPAKPGSYRGYWNLKTPDGKIFGLGPNANEPVWVDILVTTDTPEAPTPEVIATPTSAE